MGTIDLFGSPVRVCYRARGWRSEKLDFLWEKKVIFETIESFLKLEFFENGMFASNFVSSLPYDKINGFSLCTIINTYNNANNYNPLIAIEHSIITLDKSVK